MPVQRPTTSEGLFEHQGHRRDLLQHGRRAAQQPGPGETATQHENSCRTWRLHTDIAILRYLRLGTDFSLQLRAEYSTRSTK